MIKKPVLFFIQFLVVALFFLVCSMPIIAYNMGSPILFMISLPLSTLYIAVFTTDIVSWKKGKK